ncbi:hypothetical protein BHE74_00021048 [Ensete ventricosum]|nr:hypothetical protein GW17_00004426 [Ensete ventricosum]RWW71223.1 hypothetical protein BHE74_00021048 [Ensete ventricosum]RZR89962.1 hypothetical protein BHM03_00017779 [Ensete ventricosum]
MDLTQKSHQSLLPTFLYSPTPASGTRALDRILGRTTASTVAAGIAVSPAPIVAQAPNEPRKIEMYSLVFYAAGIASCGLTHMAVTPLDLVKCNMQVRCVGFVEAVDLWYWDLEVTSPLVCLKCSWACKFGFYEYFKKYFSDIVGPEYAAKYKTLIYLAGSASAKVIADVALCPFEAAKVFILLCSTLCNHRLLHGPHRVLPLRVLVALFLVIFMWGSKWVSVQVCMAARGRGISDHHHVPSSFEHEEEGEEEDTVLFFLLLRLLYGCPSMLQVSGLDRRFRLLFPGSVLLYHGVTVCLTNSEETVSPIHFTRFFSKVKKNKLLSWTRLVYSDVKKYTKSIRSDYLH